MIAEVQNAMMPRLFQISRALKETHDTFTFELKPLDNAEFTFKPGQFNMLYHFGVGEVPVSISGDPSKRSSIIHTIRAVGTVTKAMRKLKKGDFLGVRGPYGTDWPVEKATGHDVVIVAGGIGLAPLRPSIYHILKNREKYGKVVILYGARTPADILYKKELEKWRARLDADVAVTVDRSSGAWRGNVGVVTTLIAKALIDPQRTKVMLCGPEIMMRFTAQEFLRRGISQDKIYMSMERNMKCAIGFCGHCQWGPTFICKDGPVFRYSEIKDLLIRREI